MLQLNEAQLRKVGGESFRDTMMRFVIDELDAANGIGRAELHRDIEALVEAARRYGLSTFSGAAVFVVLSWVYGKGFELIDAALLSVLNDQQIAAGEKTQCLQIWGLAAAAELSGERT
jgi:hypothetical protein